MNILILYSGGLDSLIMKRMAEVEYPESTVTCVYYAHGAESEVKEISTLPDYVKVKKIDWLGEEIKPKPKKSDPFAGAIYIPGRNAVFTTLAACQYLPDEIWLGTLVDEYNDQATDKNGTFLTMQQDVLNYVLSPFKSDIRIRMPFVDKKFTKVDSVRWALQNGLSPEDLTSTTSCWHHDGSLPCGECKQCVKRFLVFSLNGLEEEYKIHPLDSKRSQKLLVEYHRFQGDEAVDIDEYNVKNMILDFINSNTIPKSKRDRLFNICWDDYL